MKGPLLKLISSSERETAAHTLHLSCIDESYSTAIMKALLTLRKRVAKLQGMAKSP